MAVSISTDEFRRGWHELLAATLGNATGAGAIMYYSMSSFMLPLEQEFGWNRSEIGLAISCLVLGWIFTMPLIGVLCDRLGPRKPILCSIPSLALVLVALSFLDGSLLNLYLLFFAGAVVGSGTLGVTYIAAISPSFDTNRGLAYGIALAGTGLSALLLPLGLHEVISAYGWRSAWLALSVVVLLQWPIAWKCIKDRQFDTSRQEPGGQAGGMSLEQALRTWNFWLLAAAFLLMALLLSGLLINLIPLLISSGFSAGQAARAAAGIGIGLLFARICVGYLLDRLPARLVAIGAFIIAALGCLLLRSDSAAIVSIAALALGFTAGAELDLLAYMTARYFGVRFHASIYAVSLSLFYVGAVFAPVLVGELYAITGNYSLVLQCTIASCVLAGALILFLGPYPSFNHSDTNPHTEMGRL